MAWGNVLRKVILVAKEKEKEEEEQKIRYQSLDY